MAATSFSLGPGDKLVFSRDTPASLDSIVFSRLGFSSPSSSSTCSFSNYAFGSSPFLSTSVTLSSSASTPSSSSSFPSLAPTLEVGVSPRVRVYVSMKVSLSISMNLDQKIGILSLFKASNTLSVMRPWWPRCWCLPSLTF